MRYYFFAFLLLHAFCALAQTHVKGYVFDSITGKPMNGTTVYWDNTQTGTTTDSKGAFSISIPSDGQLLLVCSNVNYNTFALAFGTHKLHDTLINIRMTPQVKMLEPITIGVGNFTIVNSKKWKAIFSDYFLGNDSYGRGCKILNPEKIVLRLSTDEKTLKARSVEPIMITNDWLGYKIFYEITACEINLENHSLVNYGLARFEDIEKNNTTFSLRRKELFCGSLTHFLRTLYINKQLESGFEVKKASILKNTEKDRVKELIIKNRYRVNYSFETVGSKQVPDDTAQYYYKVYISNNDHSIVPQGKLVQSEDLFITDLDILKELSFEDYLLVTYKKKEINYMDPNITPEFRLINGYENSLLQLADEKSILLYPTGRFSPPRSLLISGNWANSNTISHLLPQEYDCNCE